MITPIAGGAVRDMKRTISSGILGGNFISHCPFTRHYAPRPVSVGIGSQQHPDPQQAGLQVTQLFQHAFALRPATDRSLPQLANCHSLGRLLLSHLDGQQLQPDLLQRGGVLQIIFGNEIDCPEAIGQLVQQGAVRRFQFGSAELRRQVTD